MQIVKIAPQENGTHQNQTCHGVMPEGYAVLPDEMLADFIAAKACVDLTCDDGTPPTVTAMTVNAEALAALEAQIAEEEAAREAAAAAPTPEDDRDAMLVDLEYRLTLVELGVTE